MVALRRNYRFAETGGIYRVSTAVNSGDADRGDGGLAAAMPAAKRSGSRCPTAAKLPDALRERIVAAFGLASKPTIRLQALAQLQHFRILCALRHGPFGVENLNAIVGGDPRRRRLDSRRATAGIAVSRS